MDVVSKYKIPLIVGSILVSIAIGLTLFHQLVGTNFHGKFKSAWMKASGLNVEVSEIDLNIFKGTGHIQMITISDRDTAHKGLIYLENIEFSFSPLSAYWGPVHFRQFNNSDGNVGANIIGSGSRLKTLNERLRKEVKSSKGSAEKFIEFSQVNLGTGVMRVGDSALGADYEREAVFPKTSVSFTSEQNKILSDIDEVRHILIALTTQALQATSYPVIK